MARTQYARVKEIQPESRDIRPAPCPPQGCCPEKAGNAQISLCFEDLESEIASMERTVDRAMAVFSPVVLCQANGIVATDAPLPPRSPVAERLAEAASRIKYSRAQLEMLVDASDL